VTDHHNLPQQLPAALTIVNPKMIPGDHPTKQLSGAGVAFKVAWTLLRAAGIKDSQFLTSLLDLTALGTIADVVPLTAENRILAVNGLNLINERNRLGLKYLLETSSIKGKVNIRNINFGLAPRLNAAGRLEHASKSVELLLADDPEQARSIAQELNRINGRRQDIGSSIKAEVFAKLDEQFSEEDKILVLSGEDWHPGVIGIVASQVADRYFKPVILVGVNKGVGRGSARSVDGVNMYALLNACRDLFLDFGGHEGAAGFAIEPSNIPELVRRLKEEAAEQITAENLRPQLLIEAEIDPAIITMNLIKELDLLAPYGEGNPAPIFMTRSLRLIDLRRVGNDERHLKAKFSSNDVLLETIGFDLGDMAETLSYDKAYDIAYNLTSNEWNGFETAQFSLIDIRESGQD
jgi:single-stranded-DNA-specific exonuclease